MLRQKPSHILPQNLKQSSFLYLINKSPCLNICTLKGTGMEIEKVMINDCVPVSKESSKFRIPTIYNFTVIYP